eukprot:m.151065 g.151065  ORF g.151065 m.151065 type:complete len:64 (-) comp14243_c0_seq2:127-318(-)
MRQRATSFGFWLYLFCACCLIILCHFSFLVALVHVCDLALAHAILNVRAQMCAAFVHSAPDTL